MTNTKVFGYVRVCDKGQNVERQDIKMLELGVAERDIFLDKASGKNFDRPQYQALKSVIREGDLVYIDALDRLGRNYDEIKMEWQYITRKLNADIVILENKELFDSRKFKSMGDMGKLMEDQFLSLLAYVAEQERKKMLQRQKEGIAVARAKGKHLGRPQLNLSTLSKKQREDLEANYQVWKAKGLSGVKFMEILKLKKNSFYKIISEFEESI
ncbi:recombinase family protein [Sporosarcina psychrophila]|uniref:recombinase family protein n=1 Tax=Sporosarcina psychrophila TaxID=1476 RepID=UPI00078CDC5E|nr:recombinase family protein [Sporosarcina psychrophila]AMQ06636.1 recombinase [Sporosarcina psychrophila]